MYGIVSLLDPGSTRRVEHLWEALRDTLGLGRQYERRVPHLSYHVALRYDAPRVCTALMAIAPGMAPLRVRTAGLGVFTEPRPVLYLPVTGGPALRRLHEVLWAAVEPLAEAPVRYYRPETWMPHITLAMEDLTPARLREAVWLLAREPLEWAVRIEQVAVCRDDGRRQELEQVYALGAC